ncbi:MAG: prolyl-tRNA synthetase associated domain-containing protein [Clostridia bacterium]|nr:prolyl-tRNA synthetase associated domain-containing protein [Clostridia bacterium]
MRVYQNRPEDLRSPVEEACYDLLERLHIPFERTDHEAKDTIGQCADVEQALGISICKNLFLCNRQKTQYYLVVLPGEKKFDTKKLSKLLGTARLSFAPQEKLPELLGLQPGSVSILGLMNDKDGQVRLVMDKEVTEQPFFGCHPCRNTTSLKLRTKDVLETILPHLHHEATVLDL